MNVYVLFWFDVEDYVEPQSDEALKGLLEAFEANGLQATWKLVGEKARVLQRRNRGDIIRLIQRQDIGYHTDFHSRHPVLAEYLEQMGWEDGVRELKRRETPGYEDLVRICGPASTFGQAGGSWAPQIYPALRAWNIPLFMDEAAHIGLDEGPFWYCGLLHVNRMGPFCTRMPFARGGEGLEEGKRGFDALCERLSGTGGLLSIYYHPCEFATLGFWDGANFARGANPSRAAWRSPARRPPAQMREALELFSLYLAHIRSRPGVEVLTGRQLLNLLPDRARERCFTPEEIARLADFADGRITFRRLDSAVLAPAELFALVVACLSELHRRDRLPEPLPVTTPMGPVRRKGSSVAPGTRLPTRIFLEVCADVEDFLRVHGRLPDAVWCGSEMISPADFFLTAASLLRQCVRGAALPPEIELSRGILDLEHHVRGRWSWVIFPEDFQAPNLEELGRLQTWTLKPALLQG